MPDPKGMDGMMGFCCLFAERDEETRSLLVLDAKTFSEIGRRNMDFRSAFEFHGMHVPDYLFSGGLAVPRNLIRIVLNILFPAFPLALA